MLTAPGAHKPHRVVLYLPARQRDGTLVANHENIAQGLEMLLCLELGGVTRYPALGNYKTAAGKIHREQVEVFELYCEADDWESQRHFLQDLAEELVTLMDQESIALACDGRLLLVAGEGAADGAAPVALHSEMEPARIATTLRTVLGKRAERRLKLSPNPPGQGPPPAAIR